MLLQYWNPAINEAYKDSLKFNTLLTGVGGSAKIASEMKMSLALASDYQRLETLVSQASRRYLTIHAKFHEKLQC